MGLYVSGLIRGRKKTLVKSVGLYAGGLYASGLIDRISRYILKLVVKTMTL